MTAERMVFTGEFLDRAAGITVERPNQPHPFDMTGRLGSVVTMPGKGRYVLVSQLPDQQWLAERLT